MPRIPPPDRRAAFVDDVLADPSIQSGAARERASTLRTLAEGEILTVGLRPWERRDMEAGRWERDRPPENGFEWHDGWLTTPGKRLMASLIANDLVFLEKVGDCAFAKPTEEGLRVGRILLDRDRAARMARTAQDDPYGPEDDDTDAPAFR